MNPRHLLHTALLTAALTACGPKTEPPAAKEQPPTAPTPTAATPEPKAEPAKEPTANRENPTENSEPQTANLTEQPFPQAVDLNGFGSDEPILRKDMPTRGIIRLTSADWQFSNGAHWDTYAGIPFKAKRWGKYEVMLTYILRRSGIGSQFRMGDLVVKKQLPTAHSPRTLSLGQVYIPAAGEVPFALLTPPTEQALVIREIALIPVSEGQIPVQAEDGKITLHAKDATTWSEVMRYEPKPEKNCLGFWTDPDDFAEWEFETSRPGSYKVIIHHGCGGGNHGSQVEVKLGEQSLKFTTQDTGGFQSWQPIEAGVIELPSKGRHRLAIDPVNKVSKAVLDVHKIEIIPQG